MINKRRWMKVCETIEIACVPDLLNPLPHTLDVRLGRHTIILAHHENGFHLTSQCQAVASTGVGVILHGSRLRQALWEHVRLLLTRLVLL